MLTTTSEKRDVRLHKSYAKMLLNLAQSYREREFLRVVLVKAAGMTPTEARRHYGENMAERSNTVDLYLQGTRNQ